MNGDTICYIVVMIVETIITLVLPFILRTLLFSQPLAFKRPEPARQLLLPPLLPPTKKKIFRFLSLFLVVKNSVGIVKGSYEIISLILLWLLDDWDPSVFNYRGVC